MLNSVRGKFWVKLLEVADKLAVMPCIFTVFVAD
jgi:hypothetical protein